MPHLNSVTYTATEAEYYLNMTKGYAPSLNLQARIFFIRADEMCEKGHITDAAIKLYIKGINYKGTVQSSILFLT